ncbi:hypothetical protein Glove_110g58 [Diversispora epigaea]|uniref:BZIP domain-containing protein n=1 Tax=Diversispora epigaea TaxID=1348612 RepID=A0A397J8C8_9GLOM|nr:hypothetical protein Glove_110g58 [Diversispora epigaea]
MYIPTPPYQRSKRILNNNTRKTGKWRTKKLRNRFQEKQECSQQEQLERKRIQRLREQQRQA